MVLHPGLSLFLGMEWYPNCILILDVQVWYLKKKNAHNTYFFH